MVVVSADGLMAVPSSVHTPSALASAAESIGANLWLAVRPSPRYTPSPPDHCVTGGVRCGGAAGGIVDLVGGRALATPGQALVSRLHPTGVTQPPPPTFLFPPGKEESQGELTQCTLEPSCALVGLVGLVTL